MSNSDRTNHMISLDACGSTTCDARKRVYVPPVLVVYGAVRDLTGGGGGSVPDGNSGSYRRYKP